MKATISTIIDVTAERMWTELQKTSSLIHVTSPVLVFRPSAGNVLPETWETGGAYALRLFAFGLIPLGEHTIVVKRIDRGKKEIFTNESSTLARTWNHLLKIANVKGNVVRYTDEVEIRAGILTPFVWIFAHFFYRHRQRKWKKLLQSRHETV